jgi:transposase
MTAAAGPRAKLSCRALIWALQGMVVGHLSVAQIARALGVSWNTANAAVLAEGKRVLISDPARFEGVRVLGVDEHVWRHTRKGDKYVTVIIDLTPVADRTGPARLLDMVEGRSKAVFPAWLAARPEKWRARIEVVAMDGFTGFKTAAADELPQAVTVMDPFHVVRLAGDALQECRRRTQQDLHGHRGRKTDPLFKARRTLLTDRQRDRLEALFADHAHTPMEVTWSVYQRMVAAYRAKNPSEGRAMLAKLIDSLVDAVPPALVEIAKLGRTLNKRASDVLAYFDRPHTSNGPTEAINGRLEHLRGSALGFRNLTNYIARCLHEAGDFRPQLHPRLWVASHEGGEAFPVVGVRGRRNLRPEGRSRRHHVAVLGFDHGSRPVERRPGEGRVEPAELPGGHRQVPGMGRQLGQIHVHQRRARVLLAPGHGERRRQPGILPPYLRRLLSSTA